MCKHTKAKEFPLKESREKTTEIKVLIENNSGKICNGEKGLSFYIEVEKKKILFDTGASSLFLENASKLHIGLEDTDYIVLSHGHWDHGNGLEYIKNMKLVCHPNCFIKRYRKKDNSYIGLPINLEEAKEKFELLLTEKPYEISKNIIFLGQIPRENDFESIKTDFRLENGEDDYVFDDSALVIKSEKGLIIIPGCSHAGICNIIEYSKKITGIEKIYTLIGGLHLKDIDTTTKRTIEYLKNQSIDKLYPVHCTSDTVFNAFCEELNGIEVKKTHAGDVIKLQSLSLY